MPTVGSLTVLMREWLLNNATLTTTTHSKLREVQDGTDTQVSTCAIDRWMAKMKRTEGYITREISRRAGGFGRRQEVLLVEYQERRRRYHSRPRTEDELWPFLRHAVDDLVTQRSCLTVEGVLTKAQFLSPLLYQIHCIEPVGFKFAHIYSTRSPPKRDPTIIIIINKRHNSRPVTHRF